MSTRKSIEDVRSVLQKFENGYKERNLENLEEFLSLFIQISNVELIGIGASERGGVEWFEGIDKVREIIQSDWEYWGDVAFDVAGAKINVSGKVAWLTTTGTLEQTDTFDKALPIYLKQMKKIIEEDNKTNDEKLIEASHYGVRRLRAVSYTHLRAHET